MKQAEIYELLSRFDESGVSRFEYEADGERIVLEKYAPAPAVMPLQAPIMQMPAVSAPAPIAATTAPTQAEQASVQSAQHSNFTQVTAPLVGVFYRASAPEAAPFAKVGDSVKKGQVLCLIEAMKMINELPSPVDGVVKSILVNNEDVVSFGQALFEVEPC